MCRSYRVRASSLFLSILLVTFLAVPGTAMADDPPAPQETEHAEVAHGSVEPGHEGHEGVNSLHLFLGETWERVDGADITEKGFTFGIEYFRQVAPRWAVGAVVERAAGNIRGTLVLAQVEVNLVGGLWLVTGPGVEFRDAHEEGHGEVERHGEMSVVRAAHDIDQIMRERDTTVFVYRIGLGYGFHLSENVLFGPTIDLDFVGRDEALVVGGIFAFHF
jgi:hypothetical protein